MTGLVSNICKGSPSLSSPLQCCGDCGEGGILFWEGDLSGLCLSPGRSAHAGEEVGGLHVDGSPSNLLLCGCELDEADGWLSIFSWSLFKGEDSCGLCHGGDLTTHTPSWLPSPSSSSLMKFVSICRRAVFSVLEATLVRLMKSCKGKCWYNYRMNKFCINDGLHTYPCQALCDQCICAC